MPVRRLDVNPLITPADVPPTRDDLTVLCTLNPGAVRFGDEVLLLVRVGEAAREEPGSVGTVVYDHRTGRTSAATAATIRTSSAGTAGASTTAARCC